MSKDFEEKNKPETEEEENFSVKSEIFSYIRIILIAAVFAWLVSHFLIFNATIPSSSMENTIMTGSRVIGFRTAFLFNTPERGDIIIFKYPLDESKYYIKRIIGLPGETVTITDGKIYINGSQTALKEDYLKEKWVFLNDGLEYQVPEDGYFVMGDNRNISQDARFWAGLALQNGIVYTEEQAERFTYVTQDQILAKAIWEYWPEFKLVE